MPITRAITFKRGQTFSYVFRIPEKFSPGFFADWAISAQIRKARNTSPSGIIADINASWIDGPYENVLLLYNQSSDDWDLGDAEVDIRFESTGGHVIRTQTVPFTIVHEITK